MINELIKLSNHLDAKGLRKEADYLDAVIKKNAQGVDLTSQIPKVVQDLIALLNANGYQASVSGAESNDFRHVFSTNFSFSKNDEDGDEWRGSATFFTGAAKGHGKTE